MGTVVPSPVLDPQSLRMAQDIYYLRYLCDILSREMGLTIDSPICVRRIDALGREVVQLLEVGVHDNLFLVGVLERLGPWDGALGTLERTHSR